MDRYPSLSLSPKPLEAARLVNPNFISLKTTALQSIRDFIKTVYALSRTAQYRQQIQSLDSDLARMEFPNQSVLMAYDFHLTSNGEPKLIEVNTNASGFLISELLYTDTDSAFSGSLEKLKKSFVTELQSLFPSLKSPEACIFDEDLLNQKMLPEFYMYKGLMESWGWRVQVEDYKNLKWKNESLVDPQGERLHFLYNRLNDFYLSRPESADLRRAYFSKQTVFSPQPQEYWLLADKQRLVEWSDLQFWDKLSATDEQKQIIDRVLLKSFAKSSFESLEQIWKQRKKLFFKPFRMYGGKSAFKGANISRTAFERIFSDEKIMIQEFCPAPKFKDASGEEWKYDLRFFVYRDEIQLGIARIYQGQVTNFNKVGGGFCRIRIED